MRKAGVYILYLVFWSTSACSAFAQVAMQNQHYTDSLELLIHAAKQDTVKAALLNKLSDYWSEKDSAKSADYARQSLRLSKGHLFYTATAHFYLGGAYFYFDSIKSKKEYLKTIDILKKESSKRALSLLSRSWHNYASLIQRQGGEKKAFMRILVNHVIPLAQKADDTLRLSEDYADVGMVFSNILNYDKAIFYYKKAIRQASKIVNPPGELARFYTRLAKNYLYKDNQSKKQYPLAGIYLDSADKILSTLPLSFDHAEYNMVLGMYYLYQYQWNAGFSRLDTAISMAEQLHLPYLKTSVLFQKYEAYSKTKRYAKAKEILLSLYHNSSIASWHGNRRLYLGHLAETDAKMHNYKSAYHWELQYINIDDSIQKAKIKSDIAALEVKYKTEKKQRQILSLQNENKKQQLVLQRKKIQNIFLIAGVILLILICVIIFILYRNKKRRAIQEEKIHEQKLEQLKQQNQLKVFDAMMKGQEKERKRMARDLHDGLGGMLSGVKLKLSDIAENSKDKNDMELYKVINQLDDSVQELRRIARNMMPETLLRFGVETAIKDLCNSLQTQQTDIDFQAIQLDKDLSQTVQINIYRIVQELLTNAIRHGHTKNILVQCSQNEGRIFITVEDDGDGFDVNLLKDKKGIGLANIKNRVNFLKGNIDIQSKPEEGTIVNVEVNAHE